MVLAGAVLTLIIAIVHQILSLEQTVLQQNTRIQDLETKHAVQDTRIQDTRIQDTRIQDLETKHAVQAQAAEKTAALVRVMAQTSGGAPAVGTNMKQSNGRWQPPDAAGDFDYARIGQLGMAEPFSDASMNHMSELNDYLASIVYLPKVAGSMSQYSRLVYIDAGARELASSIQSWFYPHYLPLFPERLQSALHVAAFEASPCLQDCEYNSPEGKKFVHDFVNFAVGTENKTMQWSAGVVSPDKYALNTGINVQELVEVHSLDFAEWLRQNVRETDFVALKMDIEGSEHTVLKHMHETGTLQLVDELFLECHGNFWGGLITDIPRSACLQLLADVRSAGVFAHEWF